MRSALIELGNYSRDDGVTDCWRLSEGGTGATFGTVCLRGRFQRAAKVTGGDADVLCVLVSLTITVVSPYLMLTRETSTQTPRSGSGSFWLPDVEQTYNNGLVLLGFASDSCGA